MDIVSNLAGILLGGLSAGTVLFIVSVGLSVTMGLMGFVNLAHGAFAMFGGYVIVLAMNRAHFGFAAAIVLGFVATAALSIVLERTLYRRLYRAGEQAFAVILDVYDRSLRRALQWPGLVMLGLLATLCLAVHLFIVVPKGYMPEQDNGLIWGGIQADQSISFQSMKKKLAQFIEIIRQDPGVAKVAGFYGGGSYGSAFVVLKPLSERQASAEEVTNRLRPKLDQIAGASLYLGADQDVRVAGQTGNSGYQYTLLGEDSGELYEWAPKIAAALKSLPLLTDVNFDEQQGGLEADLIIDRATAARLGLTVGQIDNTLYDAFGQRQVSVIYKAQNQYRVVMEVAPEFRQSPEILNQIYVGTGAGPVSGSQRTQPLSGTVVAKPPPTKSGRTAASAVQNAGDVTRNAATNALANPGRSAVSTGKPRIARACNANSERSWLIIVTMPVSWGRGESSEKITSSPTTKNSTPKMP